MSHPWSLFGIMVDELSQDTFEIELERKIAQQKQVSIATINPEILLRAKKDLSFADVLNRCTYRCVDGFGITLISLVKRGKGIHRIVGRFVVSSLIRIALQHSLTIGCIGGGEGVAEKASQSFRAKNPNLRCVDLSAGQRIDVSENGEIQKGKEIIEQSIRTYKPSILFVGLGAVKQERFMLQALEHYPFILAAVGVGGILDVEAAILPRAPRWMSSSGLEWIWRLVQEPRRFTRILNAVIVFPVLALCIRTKKHHD